MWKQHEYGYFKLVFVKIQKSLCFFSLIPTVVFPSFLIAYPYLALSLNCGSSKFVFLIFFRAKGRLYYFFWCRQKFSGMAQEYL